MSQTRKFEPPAERADYPPDCAVCGGNLAERIVTISLPDPDGQTRIVHHVPCAACLSCGEQYLKSVVVRKIERLLEAPPTEHQEMPVWDFAASA